MNRTDLAYYMSKHLNLSPTDCKLCIDTFMEGIIDALEREGEVNIYDLFTIRVKRQGRMECHNVVTRERFDVEPHQTLQIIPHQKMKRRLRNNEFATVRRR